MFFDILKLYLASQPLQNTLIAGFNIFTDVVAANTSLSCSESGVLSLSSCVDIMSNKVCQDFNLNNNVCGSSADKSNAGIQTTCVAAPVGK